MKYKLCNEVTDIDGILIQNTQTGSYLASSFIKRFDQVSMM